MENKTIEEVCARLEEVVGGWETPLVDAMAATGDDPFRILIATILSLRTRDTVTAQVAPQLFARAATPEAMLALPAEELRDLIKRVGFYNNKSESIRAICRQLLEEHGGQVPDDLDTLLALPGVGRKTANLVVTAGYQKAGICVDTHVHRISNRLGYVQTKSPEQSEMALRAKLPKTLWLDINRLLVSLGQTICHPTSPKCSICPINDLCERVGVTRSR
ncbi:MAG: endonuclease III [Ardenticatenales bacterium]|nr:endonuclease III [Ardenticatenales bacterium]